jgi:cytochrome c oxidase subunit IV
VATQPSRAPRGKMLLGTVVFAGLILLDTVEFLVAITAEQVLLWMTLLALPQAGLIVWFYMHVHQLRGGER